MRQVLKRVLFWALALLLVVASIEIALHVACLFSGKARVMLAGDLAREVPDPVLGHRPNPAYPEHDANGFRNARVPSSALVIAIGDSQTYGASVRPQEAWPQQLGSLSGLETYNMAFGGYGPTHYLQLLHQALNLHPKLVVVALYTGNDLFEAFEQVYVQGKMPELKPRKEAIIHAVQGEEEKKPLAETARQVTRLPWLATKDQIFTYSRLLSLVRLYKSVLPIPYTYRPDWESVRAHASRTNGLEPFQHGKELRTVFTPGKRLLALNLEDARLREGLRISLEVLLRVNANLKKRGIRLLVLLIPTKETVFAEIRNSSGETLSDQYQAVVRNEEAVSREVAEFCRLHHIEFVSALNGLRKCVQDGNSPYRMDSDGHPNTVGQHAIAKVVHETIRARH